MNRRAAVKRRAPHLLAGAILVVTAALGGCGGDDPDPEVGGLGMAPRGADGTILDDRSLCEWKGKPELEVSETAGPGAIHPNVRRVYKVLGLGPDRRKILVCREIDTNLDGYKDVVRFYNEEGQSKEERADTNHDGKIDTWNLFSKGRLAEVKLDKNFDGEADEWKIFVAGKLSRIKRDTDFDQKPDSWEMYRSGRLERMGVDLDGDERVDRWDHDADWRKELEAADKRKREEEAKKAREREEELRKESAEAAAEMDEGG